MITTLIWLIAFGFLAAGSVCSGVMADRLWAESESEVRSWMRHPLFLLGLLYMSVCWALAVMTLICGYEVVAAAVS